MMPHKADRTEELQEPCCPAAAQVAASLERAAAKAEGSQPASERSGKAARKPKKGGRAAARARTMRVHRIVRWCVQLVFFAAAPSVFSAAFGGIKYVAGQLGLRQAVEPTSFVVLLIAVLLFTAVFGRFFCGYACAFGTLGDAVYALFTPVRRVLHVSDRPLPEKAQRGLQFAKYGVLVAICALCFTGAWASLSGCSPWTAFAGIVAGSVDGIDAIAFAVLGVIVLGMALVKRFFCQFLCPLGAVFALMPVLPFSQFSRKKSCCAKRCGKCHAGCPVDIYPDADSFAIGECIACGKCSDVCPVGNVGMVRAKASGEERPGKPPRMLLRGNEIAFSLMKAVLLLALLWVAGALSFAPAFTDATGIALPWSQ